MFHYRPPRFHAAIPGKSNDQIILPGDRGTCVFTHVPLSPGSIIWHRPKYGLVANWTGSGQKSRGFEFQPPAALGCNPGQVVKTHVSLSPSSIICTSQ